MPFTHAEVKALEAYFQFAQSGRRALMDDQFVSMVADFEEVLKTFPARSEPAYLGMVSESGSDIALVNLWLFYDRWHGVSPFTVDPPAAKALYRVAFGLDSSDDVADGATELLKNFLRLYLPKQYLKASLPISKCFPSQSTFQALLLLVARYPDLAEYALYDGLEALSAAFFDDLRDLLDQGKISITGAEDALILAGELRDQFLPSTLFSERRSALLLSVLRCLHPNAGDPHKLRLSADPERTRGLIYFMNAFVSQYAHECARDFSMRLSELFSVVEISILYEFHNWQKLAHDLAFEGACRSNLESVLLDSNLSRDRLDLRTVSPQTSAALTAFVKTFPGETGVALSQRYTPILHLVLRAYGLVDAPEWRESMGWVLSLAEPISYAVIIALNLEQQRGVFNTSTWRFDSTTDAVACFLAPDFLDSVLDRVLVSISSREASSEGALPRISTEAMTLLVAYEIAGVDDWWRAIAKSGSRLGAVDSALAKFILEHDDNSRAALTGVSGGVLEAVEKPPKQFLWGLPIRAHHLSAVEKQPDSEPGQDI